MNIFFYILYFLLVLASVLVICYSAVKSDYIVAAIIAAIIAMFTYLYFKS